MTKRKYGTCEADFQAEFPNCRDADGYHVRGKITLLEDVTNPSEAGWW